MCGRFQLATTRAQVEDAIEVFDLDDFPFRYNIAPTQPIQMVIAAGPREPGSNLPDRRGMLVRWGFIPGWAKVVKDFPLLINARSETAAEKNTFRAAMRHRRTLVPATGFYEWRRGGAKRPQSFWLRPRDGGIVAFGGLMETYSEPGGSEIDTGAILTTAASRDLEHIHHRMPVVVKPEHFVRWLDCLGNEPRDVADLLQPVEPGFFEAVPISDKVNKVANVGPDILERVEEARQEAAVPREPDGQLTLF